MDVKKQISYECPYATYTPHHSQLFTRLHADQKMRISPKISGVNGSLVFIIQSLIHVDCVTMAPECIRHTRMHAAGTAN